MNDKIPTAKETLARVIIKFPEEGDMTDESIKRNVNKMMIEFAKLHRKAILEEVKTLQRLKYIAGETGYLNCEDFELVYPENLIV